MATHGLILRLLGEGKVHGVRIDHPDGLYDPQQYLQRLQQHYRPGLARRLLETELAIQAAAEQELETLLRAGMAQASSIAAGRRCAGRSTSWWRRSSACDEALRETGRSMAPAATTFSTCSTACLWMRQNAEAFTRFYRDWTQDPRAFAEVVYEANA